MCPLIELRREFLVFVQGVDVLFHRLYQSCSILLEAEEFRELSFEFQARLHLLPYIVQIVQIRLLLCCQLRCIFRFFEFLDLFIDAAYILDILPELIDGTEIYDSQEHVSSVFEDLSVLLCPYREIALIAIDVIARKRRYLDIDILGVYIHQRNFAEDLLYRFERIVTDLLAYVADLLLGEVLCPFNLSSCAIRFEINHISCACTLYISSLRILCVDALIGLYEIADLVESLEYGREIREIELDGHLGQIVRDILYLSREPILDHALHQSLALRSDNLEIDGLAFLQFISFIDICIPFFARDGDRIVVHLDEPSEIPLDHRSIVRRILLRIGRDHLERRTRRAHCLILLCSFVEDYGVAYLRRAVARTHFRGIRKVRILHIGTRSIVFWVSSFLRAFGDRRYRKDDAVTSEIAERFRNSSS